MVRVLLGVHSGMHTSTSCSSSRTKQLRIGAGACNYCAGAGAVTSGILYDGGTDMLVVTGDAFR